MAHDHRMNQVGEPHLNARARFGQGRSDLPRLQGLITQQLESEWNNRPGIRDMFGNNGTAFQPDFEQAVYARIKNYRSARNAATADNAPLSYHERDTATEIGNRFRKREDYL